MKLKKLNALVAAVVLCSAQVYAETDLNSSVEADMPRLTQIYKQLHANPELAFMEFETSKLVAQELTELGYEVHTGLGVTGVAAVLKNGDGPTVMLRSDMDALPIEELADVPWRATNKTLDRDGFETYAMHACGHDIHTTWLIGTAKQMASRTDEWNGTLILIAQPAEELIEGANAMVEDGLYDHVSQPDILIAGHVNPIFPDGSVALRDGARAAGTDQINVTINGVGSHGANPELSIDPVVMASQAVMSYQTLVSRKLPPQSPAVLTVGAFNAGTEANIIPDSAELKINLRFYSEESRDLMIQGIEDITDNIARMYGVSEERMPVYEYNGHSMPIYNDPALVDLAERAVLPHVGAENIHKAFPPQMGSEDFAQLVSPYPETEILHIEIGAATQETWENFRDHGQMPQYFLHNPNVVIEKGAVRTGTVTMTSVAIEYFNQ